MFEADGSRAEQELQRLEENVVIAAIELTPDDLSDIDSAASKITVQRRATSKPWSE